MSSAAQRAYSDAPMLHADPLGSVQLLAWLFFHPTAWRSEVARIDPGLPPDFCLIELSPAQRKNPALRRLLISAYLPYVLPLAMLLLLVVTGTQAPQLRFGLAAGLVGGLVIGLAGSVAGSVAVSLVLGVTLGLTTIDGIDVDRSSFTVCVAFGLAFGGAGSIAGTTANPRAGSSRLRPLLGVLTGVLIGGTPALLKTQVDMRALLMIIGSVTCGWAAWRRVDEWRRGLLTVSIGLTVGALAGAETAIQIQAMLATQLETRRMIYYGIPFGMSFAVSLIAMFALAYVIADLIGGYRTGAVAGAIGGGLWVFFILKLCNPRYFTWPAQLCGGVAIVVGLTFQSFWRPLFSYPALVLYNLSLQRWDERRPPGTPLLLRWHAAFWDEHQFLPWLGLDEHLLLALERDPAVGQAAMGYLMQHPRQRWAARRAQIELDARQIEQCRDLRAVADLHQQLTVGDSSERAGIWLRGFIGISKETQAALQHQRAQDTRQALSAVADRLSSLLSGTASTREPLAHRFRPIASQWLGLVASEARRLVEVSGQRPELRSPYVVGLPLQAGHQIFVGRNDIRDRIEAMVLGAGCPPLLLYGQRRMGKTSLLLNFQRLLPATIVPLFVDLQGPVASARSHGDFLYHLSASIARSARLARLEIACPSKQALECDPFGSFHEWLDLVEQSLPPGAVGLLALDEFEALDRAFEERRLDEVAFFSMLRHMIQHRARTKILLSGSHSLGEIERWSTYLINMEVIKVGYLRTAETIKLIQHPVRDFALRYEPEALERVVTLTSGHPFLVQLLCAKIVERKSEDLLMLRQWVRQADVEAAIPAALRAGTLFFADIAHHQISRSALRILRDLAERGEGGRASREELLRGGSGPADDLLAQLRRRDLIEHVDGGYRFQVELIRRWLVTMRGFSR